MHVSKHRGGTRLNFDILRSDTMVDTYADGVCEVQIGSSQVKITLFQTRGQTVEPDVEGPIEQRQVVAILNMEVATFVESFGNVLASLFSNKDSIVASSEERHKILRQLVEGIVQPHQHILSTTDAVREVDQKASPGSTGKKKR